nr:hypothetical protein 17 [bacterium]
MNATPELIKQETVARLESLAKTAEASAQALERMIADLEAQQRREAAEHKAQMQAWDLLMDQFERAAGNQPRYLSEKEAAAYMSCSVGKLRRDRAEAKGVPYIKEGEGEKNGRVYYDRQAIDRYMEERRVDPIT